MQSVIIAGSVLAAASVSLGLIVLSNVRSARVARNNLITSDAELYAQGARINRKENRFKDPREQGELDRKLSEAGVGMGTRRWVLLVASIAAGAVAGICALTGSLPAALIALPAAYVGQSLWLGRARAKRRHLFDEQLARALPQIAAGIRTSLTLPRAIRATASYAESPLRDELQRVSADAAYSTDIVEALSRMAARTGNEHVRKLAAAVKIQDRQGGDVAPTLDLIADSINAFLACERERRTEIASTKLVKWVCALAMPVLFVFKAATDTQFVEFYTSSPLGWAVLALCAAFEVAGLALSRKITSL